MSSKSAKKYKIKIKWISECPESQDDDAMWVEEYPPTQRTYDFRTEQERDAFLRGVEQAIGHSSYEIVKEAEYDN